MKIFGHAGNVFSGHKKVESKTENSGGRDRKSLISDSQSEFFSDCESDQ
jgi:hypothetical protein